jgi:hypothetical protein
MPEGNLTFAFGGLIATVFLAGAGGVMWAMRTFAMRRDCATCASIAHLEACKREMMGQIVQLRTEREGALALLRSEQAGKLSSFETEVRTLLDHRSKAHHDLSNSVHAMALKVEKLDRNLMSIHDNQRWMVEALRAIAEKTGAGFPSPPQLERS